MTKSISTVHLITILLCISVTHACLTFSNLNPDIDSFAMCNSGNLPSEWNNQISSFIIPPGWYATAYQDADYSGTATDLIEGTYETPNISSIIIFPGCPILFQDYDLSGPSFVMCKSGDVPEDWNDDVSSIYVPSQWKLTLFQDYDYGFLGGSMDGSFNISVGIWNAPEEQNDQLSSVLVSEGCPVFYFHTDLAGPSFVMCTNGVVPDYWKKQITSIYVPSGWRLVLFENDDFTGDSFEVTEGVWDAFKIGVWNDKIQSVTITKSS